MCGQVLCEQVVCEQLWTRDDGRRRRRTGYRTKNKNPTQRYGELQEISNPTHLHVHGHCTRMTRIQIRVQNSLQAHENHVDIFTFGTCELHA